MAACALEEHCILLPLYARTSFVAEDCVLVCAHVCDFVCVCVCARVCVDTIVSCRRFKCVWAVPVCFRGLGVAGEGGSGRIPTKSCPFLGARVCSRMILYLLTGSGPHASLVVLAALSWFQKAAVVVAILFRVFVLVCLRVNSAITHTFVSVALFRAILRHRFYASELAAADGCRLFCSRS